MGLHVTFLPAADGSVTLDALQSHLNDLVRRHAGLIVTVNTDDPPILGTDLTAEYLTVARLADLDEAGVARLAANAVSASFLDPIAKHRLLAEIDEVSATSWEGPAPG